MTENTSMSGPQPLWTVVQMGLFGRLQRPDPKSPQLTQSSPQGAHTHPYISPQLPVRALRPLNRALTCA